MGSTPIDVIVALSITDEQLAVPQQLSDVPVVVERTRSHVEGAAALMGHDHSAIAESVCQLLSDRGARHIAFMPMSGVDTVSQVSGAGYALWAAANGMTRTSSSQRWIRSQLKRTLGELLRRARTRSTQ